VRKIPPATVARLPRYLHYLDHQTDRPTVSSEDIAAASGVNAPQVRRDLSLLGSFGTRGVGYDVSRLRSLMMRALGLTGDLKVAIVGAGNLGQALAGYRGFASRGFRVTALYDSDPAKHGLLVHGVEVRPSHRMAADAADGQFAIAIIATPADVAGSIAIELAGAGVKSMLNFAPARLQVPAGVNVRNVDLSTELQILSFYLGRPEAEPLAAEAT
jgi:redox-sensing transcriptional repressor